jgi:hypothetical protein
VTPEDPGLDDPDVDEVPVSLRCAAIARAHHYRPGGSAASAAAFVLVETPLPWPKDVGDHPSLAPLAPVARAHGGRVQALVPDGSTSAEEARVVVYRRPAGGDGPFLRFHRVERVVARDRLVDQVGDLLDEAAAVAAAGEPPAYGDGPVDVLVCTHGRRDVCCGADGMRTYTQLAARAVPGVRLWRTSHTGGHRFAPTAVTFPDGRAWAGVDAELLAGIVTRSVDARLAAGHDRGGVAFADPYVQAADGAVLGVEGWGWLDTSRRAEVEPLADDRRLVTLITAPATAEPVAYRVEVAVSRIVPVPDCGKPLDQARKSSPEFEVIALDRTVAAAPAR